VALRVTRIIEITYPNKESFEADRENWQLPANGSRRFGDKTYRTAVLDSKTVGDEDGVKPILP